MEGETGSTDCVRVIGALTGPSLELLFEMVGRAEVLLDLSEVREVDSDAVRLLAQLAPDQYKLLACPKWLAVRIEMDRRPRPSAEAVGNVA
jgi:ABC-type transporter Mla MlaB component